ncbi:MAG: GTP-binding protein, partial [Rhodospirillaceae bacterium]|nr:GTP-binding protein [Rhodospirillaceae bacterium]
MNNLALDAEPIPVTVLTGFLGSGKTTLLRHLLHHEDMDEAAVIVNEFGEVGLDHMLLETSDEDTLLLDNGCLCCGLRGDLVDTLHSLLERRERGEIPAFKRVMIETTGLADPVPVMQTFRTDPLRLSQYELASLVTCFDAVNGAASVENHGEAERQLALADTIVVTKGDLGDISEARAEINRRNDRAAVQEAVQGEICPDDVLGGIARFELPSGDHHDHNGHDHGHHHHDRIVTVVARGERPLTWEHVSRVVADLVEQRGDRLLRVKGLLSVEGQNGPISVDGVQHLFHRPR